MIKYFLVASLFLLSHENVYSQKKSSVLSGKIICVDAGHGGTALTDIYRVGPGGE
jgi:N-acetylmuramoyl-L-alanine amidase